MDAHGSGLRMLSVLALAAVTGVSRLDAQSGAGTGVVAGYVVDSLARRTLSGAVVDAGGITASTDSAGRFSLALSTGRHRLRVVHPAIDALGDLTLPDHLVDVRANDTTFVEIGIPSAATLYRVLCGAEPDSISGVLIGTIRDATSDASIADAEVVVAWSELRMHPGLKRMASIVRSRRTQSAPSGQYRLCGVPNDIELGAQIRISGRERGRIDVSLDQRAFAVADISVRIAGADTAVATGRIVGRLMSRTTPIADAAVFLFGREHLVTSDSTGRFVLDAVPGGPQTIEVRKLGFAPRAVSVNVRPSREHAVSITLEPVQRLAGQTVEARPIAIWDSIGFTERRRRGSGTFVDASQLASGMVDFTSALRSFSGLSATGNTLRVSGAMTTRGGGCIPTFFIDGAEIEARGGPGGAPQWLRPEQIRAMEIYRTPGQIPPRFARPDSCAAIVVWTRNRFLEEDAARTIRPPA
jgi:hypothetical protein